LTEPDAIQQPVDQLVILIASGLQTGQLMDRLIQEGFQFTKVDSSGGFLQEATLCLMIGLNRARRPKLLDIIQQFCHRHKLYVPAHLDISQVHGQPLMIEAEVGGATIFTLDVERFEQV
jgi:uncharacterized protein YaaQ